MSTNLAFKEGRGPGNKFHPAQEQTEYKNSCLRNFQGKCCPSAGLRASHCAENKLADSNDSCGKHATEENVPTFLTADNRSSHPPEHRPAQVRGRGAAPRASKTKPRIFKRSQRKGAQKSGWTEESPNSTLRGFVESIAGLYLARENWGGSKQSLGIMDEIKRKGINVF